MSLSAFKDEAERHPKAWGYEDWIINNDKYCGKILVFNRGAKFSMHYHLIKHETWYVVSGQFILTTVDTERASDKTMFLKPGDVVVIAPGLPHQLEAVTDDAKIFEVSTTHYDTDSYRIRPGDSQGAITQ
jgi:mannose-6-phosphate isomerase-like protein (cupin superfamily)